MTKSISSQTLDKLEELVKKESHSSRFFDFYRVLLQLQAEVEECLSLSSLDLSNKTISKRTTKGKPILNFEDLAENWPLIRDTFRRVTAVFGDYKDLFGGIPKSLLSEEPKIILTKKLVRSWFEGKNLPTKLAGENINPALLNLLIHQTLRPFLIKHSEALINQMKKRKWQRGCCPVCGGKPDISFLEKEIGAMWLVCSRCDAKWQFKRLICPNCGNQDPNSTTYFIDDDQIYRLYLCDKCHTYLKTIDFRKVKTQVFLPLERLLTLDMDRQGQEKGYHPGYIQEKDSKSSNQC